MQKYKIIRKCIIQMRIIYSFLREIMNFKFVSWFPKWPEQCPSYEIFIKTFFGEPS